MTCYIPIILDFRGPVMGSLKSPCATSYRSSIDTITLNCLVFEKIAFFAFWRQTDRQTNGQTDGHHRCVKPQSLYRELKSPCATSYRSSIDTITLNCLVFEKIAFFCILATDRQTDRQTDKQMDIIDA